jgi:hypothetical protein
MMPSSKAVLKEGLLSAHTAVKGPGLQAQQAEKCSVSTATENRNRKSEVPKSDVKGSSLCLDRPLFAQWGSGAAFAVIKRMP